MSIFPTKILLATDASREAEFAGQTAADLAQKTDSELHVVHVLASPLATHDPSSEHVGWYASQSGFEPEVWVRLEQREQKTLEDVVAKIEASGGKVEGSHHTAGRPDAEIVALAEELGAGSGSCRDGSSGGREDKQGAYGQRLGVGCPARTLHRDGGARGVRPLSSTSRTVLYSP
jgi:nucleotide-binding universal stress UspA family protein